MSVAYRSSATTAYGSRTSTVVSAPAGVQDGDLLLLFVFVGAVTEYASGIPDVTPPAGFTLADASAFPTEAIGDGGFWGKCWAWWKVASSEGASYTITHAGGATASTAAYVTALTGADTSTPIRAATSNKGTGGTSTALGVTVEAGDLVALFNADWFNLSNTLDPPAGTTPTFTCRTSPDLLTAFDGTMSGSGATGDKSFTNNNGVGTSSPWTSSIVAVAVAGVPAISGDGTFVQSPVSLAASGVERFAGTAASATAAPSTAAAGVQRFTGAGTFTTAAPTLLGAGVERFAGSGSISTRTSLVGTGVERFTGSGGMIAPAPSLSGGQTAAVTGTGATIAPPPSLSATAALIFRGVGSIIAPAPSMSGSTFAPSTARVFTAPSVSREFAVETSTREWSKGV